MRIGYALIIAFLTLSASAQETKLPDAPSTILIASNAPLEPGDGLASSAVSTSAEYFDAVEAELQSGQTADATHGEPQRKPQSGEAVDEQGNTIPLDRYQPHRLLGIMPNFRTVSAGSKPPPPGWKYNFKIATRQATDYSSFLFLGLTSLFAEGTNAHPALGKGVDGFYAYAWRGFLDKTDGTYLSAWFLANLLHEDTRFYPLGHGHSIAVRELYVISRQGVARTYGGRQTPNIAGLGGKALTQIISRTYYPSSTTSFGALATKFGYSVMRDVIFSNIREFYPDIAAHYVIAHRKKAAKLTEQQSAKDASSAGSKP